MQEDFTPDVRKRASVIDATLIDGDRASEEVAAYFFLIADAVTGFG